MSSPFAETKRVFLLVRYITDSVPNYKQTELAKEIMEFIKPRFPAVRQLNASYISELMKGHKIVTKAERNALYFGLRKVMERRNLSFDPSRSWIELRKRYQGELRQLYQEELFVADLWRELIQMASENDGELDINIITYTAETFEPAFISLYNHVIDNKNVIKRMIVQLLSWNCEGYPVLPIGLDKQKDPQFLEFISTRRVQYVKKIGNLIELFNGYGIKTKFTARFSPFEPTFKAIIINRRRALWTLYNIERVELAFPQQKRPNWDYRGQGLTLSEADETEVIFESIVRWFDTIWKEFSVAFEN